MLVSLSTSQNINKFGGNHDDTRSFRHVVIGPDKPARNWVCGFILTDPEHRVASDERVYDFLDAMMSPETGVHLIDAYSLGASNSKSFDMVSPERVAEVGLSDPAAFLARGILQPNPPEFDKKYVELWEEVRLGL